jgi:hypothetical protein
MTVDVSDCPECGHPAEVEWRDVLESSDGSIELAKVTCLLGHRFLLPVEWLARPNGAVTASQRSRSLRAARDAS